MASLRLERLEELDQVLRLCRRQPQAHEPVVVADDVLQRREAPIVIEATLVDLRRLPERPQGSRAVRTVRGTVSLEGIDPDLLGPVEIPARLREEGRHVAGGA